MAAKLFGVPLVVWGIVCIGLTIVWIIVWPSDRVSTTFDARYIILRWFHAATWFLLAIAAFLAAFNWFGGAGTARVVAFLSLIAYLVFMGTFLLSR